MAAEVTIAREASANSINGVGNVGSRAAKREAEKSRIQGYVLDELSIVSERFTDPKEISVEITPKGNYRIWYGDYDTGLTVGRLRAGIGKSDLRKYGLIKKF